MSEASKIFSEMNSFGVRPDLISYSTMIKGFCREKNIEQAFIIHKDM